MQDITCMEERGKEKGEFFIWGHFPPTENKGALGRKRGFY